MHIKIFRKRVGLGYRQTTLDYYTTKKLNNKAVLYLTVADPGGFIGFHGNPLSKVKIILMPIFMQ